MHDRSDPCSVKNTLMAAVLLLAWFGAGLAAQSDGAQPATADTPPIVCASTAAREHCPADTSSGVVLVRSTGAAECLLGGAGPELE